MTPVDGFLSNNEGGPAVDAPRQHEDDSVREELQASVAGPYLKESEATVALPSPTRLAAAELPAQSIGTSTEGLSIFPWDDAKPNTSELLATTEHEALDLPAPENKNIATINTEHDLLAEAAEQLGIELTPEKREELDNLHTFARDAAEESPLLYQFMDNGLDIQLQKEGLRATWDFVPDGWAEPPEEKEKRDEFALKFIEATQNFCLLVESGQLERPESLGNITNTTMSSYLERHYGFRQYPWNKDEGRVYAYGDYETILENAFSPETQAAKAKLTERLEPPTGPNMSSEIEASLGTSAVESEDVAPHEAPTEDAQSGGALQENTEEVPKAEITFFPNLHTMRAGARVAKELREQGCTVVGLEMADVGSKAEQQEQAQFLTELASSDKGPGLKGQPRELRMRMRGGFMASFMHGLASSDATIYPLDITTDHPRYQSDKQATEINDKIVAACENLTPNETIRQLLTDYARLDAAYIMPRDTVMVAQVAELAERFPKEKVGIVLGLYHEHIKHALEDDIGIKSIPVNAMGEAKRLPLPYRFRLAQEVQQAGQVKPETLERALLEASTVKSYAELTGEGWETYTAHIEKLSDDDVKAQIKFLDRLKWDDHPLWYVEEEMRDMLRLQMLHQPYFFTPTQ